MKRRYYDHCQVTAKDYAELIDRINHRIADGWGFVKAVNPPRFDQGGILSVAMKRERQQ